MNDRSMGDRDRVEDELPPTERAHERKRDRKAHAADRALMQSGQAKVFKQILDRQARLAREAEAREAEARAAEAREADAPDKRTTPDGTDAPDASDASGGTAATAPTRSRPSHSVRVGTRSSR